MTDLSTAFDPRTTLARPDLAAQALEGLVRADTFLATEAMRGAVPVADIHAEADTTSERIDQLLHGEIFDVLDRRGARVWGQARRVGTVGWMEASALVPHRALPTRRVASVTSALPLNALTLNDLADEASDTTPIGAFEAEPVAVAERLLGVPHSLGARSSVATDCSGLVQQALFACGLAGPRRSHEQAVLGVAVPRDQARRGDIVVWLNSGDHSWTGHSAFMLDETRVIHATGFHGAVVAEAFAEADARYLADGFAPAAFRRL